MTEVTDAEDAQILAGVRVVEVASWVFVPMAGAVLSDWGADVVKVEPPGSGDPQRGLTISGIVPAGAGGVDYQVGIPNRGKRSVALDLARPEGRAALGRLLRDADVFLTNFLPRTLEKLRIRPEDVWADNPRLVYARGNGYGSAGPDVGRAAYDAAAFWARGGVGMAVTPAGAEEPIGPRPAFGDVMGGLTIAGGITAALYRRERTGRGSVVDVSLLHLAMWNVSFDVVMSTLPDGTPRGNAHRSRYERANPLVGSYRTQDDRFLSLVYLQPDRYWADFCAAAGRADLAADERFADGDARRRHRRDCVEALDALFAQRPLAEWRVILDGLDGPWAPYQLPGELLEDVAVRANGFAAEIDYGDDRSLTVVAPPIQFDGASAVPRGRAPEHAEHTEQVLLEVGYSWEEITVLRDRGVFG